MKIAQYYHRFWKRIFMYSALIWVVFFYATFYFEHKNHIADNLEQSLTIALQHLDEVHRTHVELMEWKNNLSQKYVVPQLSLIVILPSPWTPICTILQNMQSLKDIYQFILCVPWRSFKILYILPKLLTVFKPFIKNF